MRAGTIFFLAFAACTNHVTEPDSVRDRLESETTELAITTADSTGSITAQRRTGDGWVAGAVDLTVQSGQLVATADSHGSILIQHLEVALGPIEIPKSVLGYEAQLTNIHLQASKPAGVVTTWTGDDEAHATAQVELELSWSLTIDGKTSPLGAPKVPAVPIEFVFTGDVTAVRVAAHALSTGMFWSWADLVKLEDLKLSLNAATDTL
jgi:hypothetical protein